MYNHRSHGDIAQLGERLNGIQEVSGSIPLISTIGIIVTARVCVVFVLYRRPSEIHYVDDGTGKSRC
jgi:hypothetical protein